MSVTGSVPCDSVTAKDGLVDLSDEVRLLVQCCRAVDSAPTLENVGTQIGWERLFRIAEFHGITGILANAVLQPADRKEVPRDVLETFRKRASLATRRSLLLANRLVGLLQLFKQHEIIALPFKGPALASRTYGNLLLRDFSDLDLLIRVKDLSKADHLLKGLGFRASCELSPKLERLLVKHENEMVYVEENGIHVDLHWNVQQRYYCVPLDPDQFWDRRVETSFCGSRIDELAEEDLLLCLALHARKHYWGKLVWVCDIAQLLRTYPNLDLALVLRRAQALNSRRIVLLTLWLAHSLLGAELDSSVLKEISDDREVAELAKAVVEFWQREVDSSDAGIRTYVRFLTVRERKSDRIRQVLRHGLTHGTAEWKEASLPEFLYLPLHLARMGSKALRSIF